MLEKIRKRENFIYSLSSDGTLPSEFFSELNALQRAKIRYYKCKYGTAWLGKINIYNPHEFFISYTRGFVKNFQADFVLPRRDKELERLIKAYIEQPFRIKSHIKLIDKIFERIEKLGGSILHWV